MANNYAAQYKWKKKHRVKINFELYENNIDLIAWLKNQESVSSYLKDLIRADMSLHPEAAAAALESYTKQNAEHDPE